MREENLYPNDGSWVANTKDQVETDPTEKAVNEKRDIIEEIVDWFDAEVAAFDSVESISFNADVDTEKFIRAWMINRGMKAKFTEKLRELQALLEDYPKK